MVRSNQTANSPTFGTLLIKRKTNERPTEWEIRLRPIAQKIRIVEKLNGGAHLMVTGSPSVAVRVYTMDDIQLLESSLRESSSESNSGNNDRSCADGAAAERAAGVVDGLCNFRDSFENSMVLFILPTGKHQRDQLGRRDSFVNSAQRSLLSRKNIDGDRTGKKKRTTRIFMVTDIQQVIISIHSTIQSLHPEKREKKRNYFAQIAAQHYLPTITTGGEKIPPTKESIANHVANTFHAWADRFQMPEGDAAVAMSFLGSLGKVATADKAALEEVPIRDASKEIISRFFGTYSGDDGIFGGEKGLSSNSENLNVSTQYNQLSEQRNLCDRENVDPQSVGVTDSHGSRNNLNVSEFIRSKAAYENHEMNPPSLLSATNQYKNINEFNNPPINQPVNRAFSNIPQSFRDSMDPPTVPPFRKRFRRNYHSPSNHMDFITPNRPPTRQYQQPQNEVQPAGYRYDNTPTFPGSYSEENYYAPPPSRSALPLGSSGPIPSRGGQRHCTPPPSRHGQQQYLPPPSRRGPGTIHPTGGSAANYSTREGQNFGHSIYNSGGATTSRSIFGVDGGVGGGIQRFATPSSRRIDSSYGNPSPFHSGDGACNMHEHQDSNHGYVGYFHPSNHAHQFM